MPSLEFIVALIFVFLLISLFVSWIVNAYASRMNRKGRFLEKMLMRLLGKDESVNWTARLYRHPMIESLSYKSSRLTSHIPDKIFSQVMADLIIELGRDYSIAQNDQTKKFEYDEEASKGFMPDIRQGINLMKESDLKRIIKLFFEKSEGRADDFLSGIETWFNEYMLRVNHAYKRLLRLPLWVLGVLVAVSFNIDAIRITTELWTDSQLTKDVAVVAEEFVDQYPDIGSVDLSRQFFQEYKESLRLPAGWGYERDYRVRMKDIGDDSSGILYWLMKVLGFMLTGIVASFGAPFWYDALQKIVGLRKSMKIKTE